MKPLVTLLALTALTPTLSAQITVTNAAFPAAGDTLHLAVDLSPGTIGGLTPPGAQDWDFTGLTADLKRTVIYRPASEGQVGGQFPEATLFTEPSPQSEAYWIVSPFTVEHVADSGPDEYGFGIQATLRYKPPLLDQWAPMNFFDIKASSSGILQAFPPEVFPPAFLAALPITADSFRLRVSFNTLSSVEAYGNLSLPGGQSEVLRVKRTVYREARIDAKIPVLGWLDVTDLVIQYTGNPKLGVDTTVSYLFYDTVSTGPVAEVTLDKDQGTPLRVQYKDLAPVVGIGQEDPRDKPVVRLFPNPAADLVTVDIRDAPPGSCQLELVNVLGVVIDRRSLFISGPTTCQIPVAHFPSGAYTLRLLDEGHRIFRQETLIKP